MIGSGPEQIELIKQAKSMGAYVISTDKKTIPNIKKIVDKFYKLSASNFKKFKICIKNKSRWCNFCLFRKSHQNSIKVSK